MGREPEDSDARLDQRDRGDEVRPWVILKAFDLMVKDSH